MRVANDYRWIWTAQQRFLTELSWRAPGLKAPTALFFENEPFPNQGLFSTSASLNLLYPQSVSQGQPLGYLGLRPAPALPARARLVHTFGVSTTFRTLTFQGSTPNSLLLYKDPRFSNCLWVLSERDQGHPYLPELVRAFLPISNLERIDPNPAAPANPPTGLLNAEPENSWCYYFEKADLARQQGDWQQAASLADEALARGYSPDAPASNSPYEWLPFIEGLANVGRLEEAANLTRLAFRRDHYYQAMLCRLWTQDLEDSRGSGETQPYLEEMLAELGCAP